MIPAAILALLAVFTPARAADGARRQAGTGHTIPSRRVEPRLLARIPFGGGVGSIPEYTQGAPGEGYPTSFLFDGNQCHILVPQNRTILVFDRSGKFAGSVRLRNRKGHPLPAKSYLFDFSVSPDGDYLVLDRSGGWIGRFDRHGTQKGVFGQALSPDAIYTTEDGDTVIHDATPGSIYIYDDRGTYLGEMKDPYLSPYMSPGGIFVRTRTIGQKRAFVWFLRPGSQIPSIFSVIGATRPSSKLYQATALGFDHKGRLYILTTEKDPTDDEYSSFIYRYSPDGLLEALFEIKPNLERLADLPRSHRLSADGRVTTFRVGNDYEILVYDLGN